MARKRKFASGDVVETLMANSPGASGFEQSAHAKEVRKKLTVRVSEDLFRRYKRWCFDHDISLAKQMEHILEDFLQERGNK